MSDIKLNPSINAKLANVALNNVENLLDIEDFNPGNSGTVRVLLNDNIENSTRYSVVANTLQKLLTHINVEFITLMKIDVEGYELNVLEWLDW